MNAKAVPLNDALLAMFSLAAEWFGSVIGKEPRIGSFASSASALSMYASYMNQEEEWLVLSGHLTLAEDGRIAISTDLASGDGVDIVDLSEVVGENESSVVSQYGSVLSSELRLHLDWPYGIHAQRR